MDTLINKSISDNDGEKNGYRKSGFSVELGSMFDFCVNRKFVLMGKASSMSYSAIRVKPYINVANFSEIGWSPSINISVSWAMQTRGLSKKN